MENDLISSLDEFNEKLIQRLKTHGYCVFSKKLGDNLMHTFADRAYTLSTIGCHTVRIVFLDTRVSKVEYSAMTEQGVYMTAVSISSYIATHASAAKVVSILAKELKEYKLDKHKRNYETDCYSFRCDLDENYAIVAGIIKGQIEPVTISSFTITIPSRNIEIIKAMLLYGCSKNHRSLDGNDHIKAALSGVYSAARDKDLLFKCHRLVLYSTAAFIHYALDGADKAIIITALGKQTVLYTDVDTGKSMTAKLLVGEYYKENDDYEIFKTIMT